ncbi:MAG: DMT family protein [Verrucomicrobia bacterium]|nr:DMT family protein [Verrucomicrobiota bacterium]
MQYFLPIALLIISNIFMTFAWYGHLRFLPTQPIWIVVLFGWGLAFFEYGFMIPANRIAFVSGAYNLQQIKIIQEVITLSVFVPFAIFVMKQPVTWNFFWAGLCLAGAVFFIFKATS